MAFGIPGTEGIGAGFSFDKLMSGTMQFITLLGLFILVGVIIWYFYYLKRSSKAYNKKIFWFEEVNGSMVPIGEDLACELTIPNTSVNVFYIKDKDMYLPRPQKAMGKNRFWFVIKKNGEIVNFVMKNMNEEMKEANLEYDHTDMRYALTNLKDLIKRNYRDKSQPWWREFKDVIAVVVLVFVLTLSFVFIISKMGGLVDKIGVLIEHADQLIQILETKSGSGVILT